MEKSEIRRRMRAANRSLSAAERADAAERIFRAIGQLPRFKQEDGTAGSGWIGLYCSLPDEPPTEEVLQRWAAAGRRLAVPRVEGDTMRFYPYDPATLRTGAFGIPEPAATTPLPPSQLALVVVPGVAFTAAGERLGRGRGYYDRYLSQPDFHGYTIGVCYAHQLVGTLPVEPHDIRMHRVITG